MQLDPSRWDPIGSPETSVLKHLTPRNDPENGRIQVHTYKYSLRIRQKWLTCEMDSSSWGQKSVAGSCEDGNELLSSIKYGEFVASFRLLLTLFHTVQNIRKTCAAGPQHDIRITISSNAIIGTRRLRRTKYNPTWIPVCIREVPGSSLRLRDRTFFFVSPSHSVQIPKQYLQIRPRPLPIAPFPIHNLLITVIWRHVVVINKKAKKKR